MIQPLTRSSTPFLQAILYVNHTRKKDIASWKLRDTWSTRQPCICTRNRCASTVITLKERCTETTWCKCPSTWGFVAWLMERWHVKMLKLFVQPGEPPRLVKLNDERLGSRGQWQLTGPPPGSTLPPTEPYWMVIKAQLLMSCQGIQIRCINI